jgi:hypothetical protein
MRIHVAHDAVLINEDCDGDGSKIQSRYRVVNNRPCELFPLRVQASALGVLFLYDSEHGEFA